jgi:teichuronic acid biosynthesis glycosyltransferase TuaG
MGKNDSPLVSIIVPAYNAEPYLAAALDSALAQTYPDIEVVVVNNGSGDGTADICRRYGARIVCIELRDNVGVSGARRIAIDRAQGEFITFVDADDLLLPNKVERQVAYLQEHPECDICYSSIYHFYDSAPDNLLTLQAWHFSGAEVFPHLLKRNFINPLAVMMRRSVIERFGNFDPIRFRAEDWEFWLRVAYGGGRFCFMPETLAKYRMTPNSLSRAASALIPERRAMLGIFTEFRARVPKADIRKYHLDRVVWYHRLKLWYTVLSAKLSFLDTFRLWLQRKRFEKYA